MNLLKNDDVEVLEVEGKKLLLINVPRAARKQRPVYVGQNPQSGTFRRYHAGDYKCQPEAVASMWADQNEVPADAQILTGFNEKDIDKSTLQQYRNRFSAVRPEHPWLTLDTIPFLQKLGGWRQDRETREEGFTVAGILMFGTEDAILALSTQRPYEQTTAGKYHYPSYRPDKDASAPCFPSVAGQLRLWTLVLLQITRINYRKRKISHSPKRRKNKKFPH